MGLSKGLCITGIESKTRHEDIASEHPEHLAQMGQGFGHAACRFQCAAVVTPFVRVNDLQSPSAAIAQRGLELIFQVRGVDDHALHTITRQGLEVPFNQAFALHHQQWLGGVVSEGAHAFATSCRQDEGRHICAHAWLRSKATT
jgi:hypothetical protein